MGRVRREGRKEYSKDSVPATSAGRSGWAGYGTGKERFLLLLYHTGGGEIKGILRRVEGNRSSDISRGPVGWRVTEETDAVVEATSLFVFQNCG